MKISKSYNRRNGVTYVYEVLETHWNPEKKRGEPVRKLIGKIDPVTGNIVPTGQRGRPRKKSTPDSTISSDAESTTLTESIKSDSPDPSSPDYKTLYETARMELLQKDKQILQLENTISQYQKACSNFVCEISSLDQSDKGACYESKRSDQSP